MDRERLNALLQNPSLAGRQDLEALRSMAERFPWFSGAHLLLAVGEHAAGDILANDRLSTPAAFMPSRAVLYDLVRKEEKPQLVPLQVVKEQAPSISAAPTDLHTENIPEKTNSQVEELPTGIRTIAIITPPIPIAPDPKSPEPLGVAGPGNEITGRPSTAALGPAALVEDQSVIKEVGDFIPPPSAQQATPQGPALSTDILALQIEEAIRASGYELSHSVPPPPAPPQDTLLEEPLAADKTTVVPPSAPLLQVAGQEEAAGVPLTITSRLRFTDWLDQQGPMEAPPALAPAAPAVADKVFEARPVPPLAPSPQLSTEKIMEEFIQRSAPVAIKAKASFFNPQQAAKKSLVDDGLVSETLAQILEKQGNFTKAKEVYDRLASKHPEKSVYFAALSKALAGRSNK